LNGRIDGGDGYEVLTERSTAFFAKQRRRFTCRGVVFAASALGTMDLLFRLRDKRSLPAIGDQLGNYVRTNAESLIGVRVPGTREDLSKGVAIGSGIYIDEHTHIEATRYPAGSDAMGLLATLLTGGRPGRNRIGLWLKTLALSFLRHPFRTWRSLHPFGWARESLILLCMQNLDGYIAMRPGRRWYFPFGKVLMSRGERIPTFIPQANEFARKTAELIGGTAMSMTTEILFDMPGTYDGRFAGTRSRGSPKPRLRLQKHVHLRRLGAFSQSWGEPEPDDYSRRRTRDELHSPGRCYPMG
jgi:cholesterol oxidase